MPGVERIFDITRQTVARWTSTHIQKLSEVVDSLLPAFPDDVLELDEVWSFVLKKEAHDGCGQRCADEHIKSWRLPLVTASLAPCFRLWKAIPDEYKHGHTFSDFWIAYQQVFPAETHHCVGIETGETAQMERWNNTLRRRMSRDVRQT